MKYVLFIRGDGEPPGHAHVSDDYEPQAGEVLVDRRPEPGEVWDAARGELRPKADAERLEEAKLQKIADFHARAIEDLAAALPEGRDELASVHNATLIAICGALNIPVDARMREVYEVQRKAFAKKAAIEAATTAEELEEIIWSYDVAIRPGRSVLPWSAPTSSLPRSPPQFPALAPIRAGISEERA